MTRLEIGASIALTVDPREICVPTGLEVTSGERYRFVASGKWKDWTRVVDADGWKLCSLQRWSRVPGAGFFCLCGRLGDDDHDAFAIGAEREWVVPETAAAVTDRQLQLFANDWRCMYWNNRALPAEQGGPLSVSITRLA